MSEIPEKKLQPQELDINCSHQGFFNPIVQTTIDMGDKIMVLTGTNCRNCGKEWTTMELIPLVAGLAKPVLGGPITP